MTTTVERTGRRRRTALRAFGRTGVTLLGVAISVLLAAPIFWVIVTSLKDATGIAADPLGLPTNLVVANYERAWHAGHFDRYFMNSLLVVVPSVTGVLGLSLLSGFAFALWSFPGKRLLFGLFLLGLTLPLGVLVIPLFYQMKALGLLDSLWALILPQVSILLPFGTLMMRAFIQDLASEIFDAARIDGCTSVQLLRLVVVPLVRPALLSLMVLSFMWTWNQFLLPVVLTQSEGSRTLPLGLNLFKGRYGTDLPLLMAGATITFLPVVLVYLALQRHFIKGISAGALK
jgi:raffinose/stachyose/melibiose transport system permease protein